MPRAPSPPTRQPQPACRSRTLALRSGGRLATFELPFLVLPDRPGSVALDQRLRWTVPESNTLVSPEIMVRAAAGETRSLRRCFDPPAGWRFDKEHRRVVIVERLGWLDDLSDPTLNGGTVEFAPTRKPARSACVVSAKPVTAGRRTATIGRFEATLVRDQPVEQVVKSGVRALDWREPVRLPIEPEAVERKLYVRLFDEVDREFAEPTPGRHAVPAHHARRRRLVLQADPSADPSAGSRRCVRPARECGRWPTAAPRPAASSRNAPTRSAAPP